MAEVTRGEALAQVRGTIGALHGRMREARDDTDYLPPEGARMVDEYCSFENDCQTLVLKAVNDRAFLDGMDDRMLLEYCAVCERLDEAFELESWRIGTVERIIGVADLSRFEKIKKAIQYSDVLNEIREEIGDINILATQMVVVSSVMAGLAVTGLGAMAEALGFVLLAVGAAFSGTDLINGIAGLVKFFTTVDDAKTEEDLKSCGSLFGDAVAKIGVDGLFFALSLSGLKNTSANISKNAVVDNSLNSNKWKEMREEKQRLLRKYVTYEKSCLKELKNTENLTDSAIDHIFEGNINRRGQAGGYHYECIEGTQGKTIPGTEMTLNNFGVYEAQVEVNTILKIGNGGYSTFFPKDMSPQMIIDSINEAYNTRIFKAGNEYYEYANNGLKITMYINQNKKIISAFPSK